MYLRTLHFTHLEVISFAMRFMALTTNQRMQQTMQQRIRQLATYLGVEGK